MSPKADHPIQTEEELAPIILGWKLDIPLRAYDREHNEWRKCRPFHSPYRFVPERFFYQLVPNDEP